MTTCECWWQTFASVRLGEVGLLCRLPLPAVDREKMGKPLSGDLGLGHAKVIGWRDERIDVGYGHHHDRADALARSRGAGFFEEPSTSLEVGSRSVNLGCPAESVTLADDRVHHIDLNVGISV